MVFLESLQDFAEQAEAIFVANPKKTRYVINYHHSKGELNLKATDDVKTAQFRTDQQSDLRKVHSHPQCRLQTVHLLCSQAWRWTTLTGFMVIRETFHCSVWHIAGSTLVTPSSYGQVMDSSVKASASEASQRGLVNF